MMRWSGKGRALVVRAYRIARLPLSAANVSWPALNGNAVRWLERDGRIVSDRQRFAGERARAVRVVRC